MYSYLIQRVPVRYEEDAIYTINSVDTNSNIAHPLLAWISEPIFLRGASLGGHTQRKWRFFKE